MQTKVLISLFITALVSIAADQPEAKQLAGPPSDFMVGVMSPIDYSKTGILSRTTLIPVELHEQGNQIWSWQSEIVVDKAGHFAIYVLAGREEDWSVALRTPNSRSYQPIDQVYHEYKRTSYGLNEELYPGDHYTFEGVTAGTWTMKISTDAPTRGKGFVLYGSEGPYRLYTHQSHGDQLVGTEISFLAYGFNADTKQRDITLINSAYMRVSDANGNEQRHAMYDDGEHNDDLAGDGKFGAAFTPSDEGTYNVQVIASGKTPEGSTFQRTAEHTLAIIASGLQLSEGPAIAEVIDGGRLNFSLNVDFFEEDKTKYRVFAEVWGQDLAGEQVPISWIGGMVTVEKEQLNLPLDGRWFSLANASAPFELRNIRIEDPDHYIPVARAYTKAVIGDELPQNANIVVASIEPEMLMGQRPERKSPSKIGHTLMVVHGYCSSDVWGGNMRDFANATKFTDFNQNRSHDAFAHEILAQGSSYDGYGIVAHSQGGCASLHLYTYYWSGLDYSASGTRLIQTVGTPYQGTPLAGNLAMIGAVFGVGCGTNSDLTYAGASGWLAGIPTWARNETNYYTTSYEDHWYFDYCHPLTDLFLTDPNDGTTERSHSQLPNGVNLGHQYGWCHTNEMRDPGQCTDSNRNRVMSINAAR